MFEVSWRFASLSDLFVALRAHSATLESSPLEYRNRCLRDGVVRRSGAQHQQV